MSLSLPSWHAKVLIAAAALLFVSGGYLAYVKTLGGAAYARRDIDSMRSDIAQLRRDNARLRSQLAGLSEGLVAASNGSMGAAPSGTSRPLGGIPARLAARISKLRDFLSAHPEWADPEMRLLKDDDWVLPVREERVDTEASERKALAMVRMAAHARLGAMVAAAIRDFADANNGQQPSSAAQLVPHLSDPSSADLLQGFGKPDSTAPTGCVFQKTSAVDAWYGTTCYVCENQFVTSGTGPGLEVERAIAAFQRTTGNPPGDASQIIPYLQGSVSPDVAGAVFDALRPSPDVPPAVAPGTGSMISFSGSVKPD